MTDARVCDYILRCAKAEKETQKLTERLQALVTGSLDCLENEDVNDKEFLNLLNENKKLKYRINILKKTCDATANLQVIMN